MNPSFLWDYLPQFIQVIIPTVITFLCTTTIYSLLLANQETEDWTTKKRLLTASGLSLVTLIAALTVLFVFVISPNQALQNSIFLILNFFFGGGLDTIAVLFVVPLFLSLIALPFTLILTHSILKMAHFKPQTRLHFSIILSLIGGIVTLFLFLTLFFTISFMDTACQNQYPLYHLFNSHLQDVCLRYNQAECPKKELELAAFNPELYRQLTSCAKTAYFYDSDSAAYTWIVRFPEDRVFVSHPNLPGYFGTYTTKPDSNPNQFSLPAYPPPIKGPWHLLP